MRVSANVVDVISAQFGDSVFPSIYDRDDARDTTYPSVLSLPRFGVCCFLYKLHGPNLEFSVTFDHA